MAPAADARGTEAATDTHVRPSVRWWRWCRRYVDRQGLAPGAAAARHRQGHRVIPGIVVRVRWALRRAVRRTIAKVPVPARDAAAAGPVRELHRQRRLARSCAR